MTSGITRADVREALNRIVTSPVFEKSGRARELLSYLVEEEIEGRGGQIKGFTIAVDVFNRDAGFDASNDPLVRVHVGRLRELLAQYYAGAGAADELHIKIPKGGYRPEYQLVSGRGEAKSASDTARAIAAAIQGDELFGGLREALPTRFETIGTPPLASAGDTIDRETGVKLMDIVVRHVRLYWMAFGLIIAMLAYLLYSQLPPRDGGLNTAGSPPTEASTERRGHRGALTAELLPSIEIIQEGSSPELQQVASELGNGTPRFDVVTLLRPGTAAQGPEASRSVHYLFRLMAGSGGSALVVNLENQATGAVLMSETIDPDNQQVPIKNQVARILTRSLSDNGLVLANIDVNGSGNSITQCLLLNQAYFRQPSDLAHRKAYDCFDRLAKKGARSPLVFSELASLTCEAVTHKRRYPEGASGEAALKLAEKAMALGPESAHAHGSMSFVLAKTGNGLQSVSWAQKAHELNPYNIDLTASYGYSLTMTAGDFTAGQKMLREAVDTSTSAQPWWVYGLAMGLYMNGDVATAYGYADLIRSKTAAHYLGIRLILAHEADNEQEAESLRQQLQKSGSEFSRDPAAYYAASRYPKALQAKLLEGLEKAGFVASPR